MTTYTAQSKTDEFGNNAVVLNAKTDEQARTEAARVAKSNGWAAYWINFHRDTDGCRGTIEP